VNIFLSSFALGGKFAPPLLPPSSYASGRKQAHRMMHSPVSVVTQAGIWLRLRKRRSVAPYRPSGSGMTLRFYSCFCLFYFILSHMCEHHNSRTHCVPDLTADHCFVTN